ncbi:MAG: ATP-grasp domain-containing protein [Thermoplasmatota archaeon]
MTDLYLAVGHAGDAIFHDDVHLPAAFAEHGIDAVPRDWKAIEPDGTPVLIRTPWDYAQHAMRFMGWLDALDAADTPVLNPTDVLRWNLDKRYLLDLEVKGHAIVPTRAVRSLDKAVETAQRAGWADAVAKPVIGGGAEGLHRIRDGQLVEVNADANPWGAAGATGRILVQPYLPEIQAGEWSLYFFAGAYSHAVLKTPAAGDFRIQEEHGGATQAAKPPAHVLAAAQAISADVPDALYARVDGVVVDGRFLLMELELIEPELYFRYADGAEARFAKAVADALRA